jgi:gas vesicle protein
MESSNASAGTVLLALLGGAVLGAGAALLYAPQSGRRTRARIRTFGEEAGESARELLSKTEEYLEEARAKAGESARDLLTKTEEYLEEARSKTERVLEDAMNKTEQCLEDARTKGEEWMHKGHGCAVEKRQQAAAEAAAAAR